MDLSNFKTDNKLEEEGSWVQVGKDAKIKVARIRNKKYLKLFKRLAAPYKSSIRKGSLEDSVADDILNKCIAETVLLDWKGLSVEGSELEYSSEEAYKILSNPEYKDFKDMVVEIADDMEVFKNNEEEEDIKNLPASSVGE